MEAARWACGTSCRATLAWKNKASGFYGENHSTGGTPGTQHVVSERTQYNMLAEPRRHAGCDITLTGALRTHADNIGFPNRNSNMTGVDAMLTRGTSASRLRTATSSAGRIHRVGHRMSIESSGALVSARGGRHHAEDPTS